MNFEKSSGPSTEKLYDLSAPRIRGAAFLCSNSAAGKHPLVGVKVFYDDEGQILKNRLAHAQKNRTILVLREYASQDFSGPTPRPENNLSSE